MLSSVTFVSGFLIALLLVACTLVHRGTVIFNRFLSVMYCDGDGRDGHSRPTDGYETDDRVPPTVASGASRCTG